MKKHFIAVIALAITLASVTGCKKEKTVDCTKAVENITNAATAYMQDQSAANCNSYKSALQEYSNSDCFDGISAEQKAQYQEAIDMLTCPE